MHVTLCLKDKCYFREVKVKQLSSKNFSIMLVHLYCQTMASLYFNNSAIKLFMFSAVVSWKFAFRLSYHLFLSINTSTPIWDLSENSSSNLILMKKKPMSLNGSLVSYRLLLFGTLILIFFFMSHIPSEEDYGSPQLHTIF